MGDKKVVFLIKDFGLFSDELLYWEPVLAGFLREFPKAVVLNLKTKTVEKETGHPIIKIAPFKNIFGPIAVFLSVMRHLRETSPELLILSEFNQTTIYGIFYRFFHKSTHILLLVENDPRFLAFFYGVNRKNKFFKIFRKWIVSKVDFVLANNDLARRYLIEELKAGAGKILLGPYLTSSISDHSNISPKKLHPAESLGLLTVGRLSKGKGVHHLLQALAGLPGDDLSRVHLTIVGDGPERITLEALAEKYGLGKSVTFAGKCPYEEVGRYYRNAHVFVFPTLGDYSGMVYFEALSAGLPVIGSIFAGASGDVVGEGVNGFILDPRDTKVLSETISRFLNEPQLIEKFSRESLKKSPYFSVDKAVNNFAQACYQCCNE